MRNSISLTCGRRYMDVIDYLIDIGVNVNGFNRQDNMTPLMKGSFTGQTDAIILLKTEADVNIKKGE